ncbi:serine hydrolase [Terrimonas alba]|uniref:serine hydrolase n=1 Tax=Terrimonas alba TaxID=3349636 RepID=UPI0035F3ADBA
MTTRSPGKTLHAGLLFVFLFFISQLTVLSQDKITGYGKASYHVSQAGKFMHTWLVAGPVSVKKDTLKPDDAWQEKVFKANATEGLNFAAGKSFPIEQKEYNWQFITGGDIIDLDTFYKGKDFAYAYAMAEIKAAAPASAMLAVGSDDGIKIWLNGKLVHENWIPRGVNKDDDLVPLKLVKGSNQIVLKVQDIEGGWGFAARLLDKAASGKQLNTAAANGNLDKIQMLIEHGADVNTETDGITPVVAAKIGGRNEMVKLLLKKGAKDKPVPSSEIIVDNFYKSLKSKDYPGIAVLVARDGAILYKKGFGYADIKNKVPATPGTKFRIGSVTKQFTAAAILKLQENGLLSVNDKLSKFLPDFPRGDEVTIHQLMTHISGIHSYTGKPDFLDKVTKTISPDSLIAYFRNDPYDFNPGERYQYNNSAYFLLGYIVSKVSGKPYEAYLKETFFDPLQMNNTGVHYAGIKLEQEAKGYSKSGNKYDESLNWDMSWAGGAGAMYSTVDDLLKWNQALYNGKVLNEKSYQAAITPVVLKDGKEPPNKYGYGLGLNKYRGLDIIGHGGGLHGFLTQLLYYPKEKMTVVMFTNTSDPEINFDPNKIAEAWLWNKMDTQSSYSSSSVAPTNLERFTGRYELTGMGVLTVTTAEGKLFAQLSGQPKFEIFPASEYEFFWKVVEARLKFDKDEKGIINKATLFQNGQQMVLNKLPEEKIATIDPAVLDNYTGKYRLNSNIVITIFKENNKLYAHPTGQSRLEMLPQSDTDFVILEINAKLSFVKGEDGKATKLNLNMNNTNSELPRIE